LLGQHLIGGGELWQLHQHRSSSSARRVVAVATAWANPPVVHQSFRRRHHEYFRSYPPVQATPWAAPGPVDTPDLPDEPTDEIRCHGRSRYRIQQRVKVFCRRRDKGTTSGTPPREGTAALIDAELPVRIIGRTWIARCIEDCDLLPGQVEVGSGETAL